MRATLLRSRSHGFDHGGDLPNLIIWIDGKRILVDASPKALAYLEQMGVTPLDVPNVFLTHARSDHDGGLVEKLLSGSRTTVIAAAADPVFRGSPRRCASSPDTTLS